MNYSSRDMNKLRREHGGRCERCGSRRKLEFAHQQQTGLSGQGRGLNHRYLDIKKHPEAYDLLCHACHRRDPGYQSWKQQSPAKAKTTTWPKAWAAMNWNEPVNELPW